MISIAKFYTLFRIIYSPTCLAFNEVESLPSVDEVILGDYMKLPPKEK